LRGKDPTGPGGSMMQDLTLGDLRAHYTSGKKMADDSARKRD